MLGERKHIAVGILEPGDFGSPGKSRDPYIILSHVRITLERHSLGSKLRDVSVDIARLPAKHCIRGGSKLGHSGDTKHDSVEIEDQRKSIVSLE